MLHALIMIRALTFTKLRFSEARTCQVGNLGWMFTQYD